MKLSPRELEGLLIHQTGCLAQQRLARGVKLNHPEAVALISSQLLEFVRDGTNTVADLMQKGRELLGFRQVQPGVPDMIPDVQIEATFHDGTKLVTVHNPICREDGNLELALYGSFLPVPDLNVFTSESEEKLTKVDTSLDVKPGEIVPANTGPIEINKGRERVQFTVTSVCDRPIQKSSKIRTRFVICYILTVMKRMIKPHYEHLEHLQNHLYQLWLQGL